MAKKKNRPISFDDALRFQPYWSGEDRDVAREVIAWAQSRDQGVAAEVPPAEEVVVLVGTDGRRILTLRQGYIRIHDARRPPFDGAEPGVRDRSWEVPLSRRRRRD